MNLHLKVYLKSLMSVYAGGKILLKHGTWDVSDIACALGFTEITRSATSLKSMFSKSIEV